jgi:hypothetical protein
MAEFSNPQPNPQNVMSYTTSAYLGSPRGFISRCKIDTVEVRSSSLLVPTISFNGLASLTSLREAPNGSMDGEVTCRIFRKLFRTENLGIIQRKIKVQIGPAGLEERT